jgi:hypothetical protein
MSSVHAGRRPDRRGHVAADPHREDHRHRGVREHDEDQRRERDARPDRCRVLNVDALHSIAQKVHDPDRLHVERKRKRERRIQIGRLRG